MEEGSEREAAGSRNAIEQAELSLTSAWKIRETVDEPRGPDGQIMIEDVRTASLALLKRSEGFLEEIFFTVDGGGDVQAVRNLVSGTGKIKAAGEAQ